MEFDRFPPLHGNGWASGMGIGIFGVVDKTFVGKLFSRNVVFCVMKGNVFTVL